MIEEKKKLFAVTVNWVRLAKGTVSVWVSLEK